MFTILDDIYVTKNRRVARFLSPDSRCCGCRDRDRQRPQSWSSGLTRKRTTALIRHPVRARVQFGCAAPTRARSWSVHAGACGWSRVGETGGRNERARPHFQPLELIKQKKRKEAFHWRKSLRKKDSLISFWNCFCSIE